MSNGLLITF